MAYAELSEPEYSRVGAPNVLGRERKLKAEKEIHFFARKGSNRNFRDEKERDGEKDTKNGGVSSILQSCLFGRRKMD